MHLLGNPRVEIVNCSNPDSMLQTVAWISVTTVSEPRRLICSKKSIRIIQQHASPNQGVIDRDQPIPYQR